MKLSPEELEALQAINIDGIKVIMKLMDGIVNNIQGTVLSVPLDKDPAKAQIQLYVERMKFEGAKATRMALTEYIRANKEIR